VKKIDQVTHPGAANAIKVAVCEYLLKVNRDHGGPFIPPTAIDWLGDGIVDAIEAALDA
jgi:hypothetical protein